MTPIWLDGADVAAIDGLESLRGSAWFPPIIWRVPDDGSIARHSAAVTLVAHLAGRAPETVSLARTRAGAPTVARPAGWHIGLARRGGSALIAAAPYPVAVDRELLGASPPLWDMLTPIETAALTRLRAGDRPDAWLRRWTIKEAHAKLIGEPRRIAPERIATRITSPTDAFGRFEGVSRCWSRERDGAIETVAVWAHDVSRGDMRVRSDPAFRPYPD